MTAPAILDASRGLGRTWLTGIIAVLGLAVALVGWIVLLADIWGGIGVVAVGLVLVWVGEGASRRYRLVTVRGLRWQRSASTESLDWHTVRLGTKAPPGVDSGASDRILVQRPDGSVLEWPEPATHGACQTTLAWWQHAQQTFPRGDFRAVPGLRQAAPHAAPHRVHNPVRRWWHLVLALPVAAVLVAFAGLGLASLGDGQPATAAGWAIAAIVVLVGLVACIRNATSAVRVEPDRIVHRRPGAWRTVRREDVVGAYGFARPGRVTFAGLAIVMLIASIFDASPSTTDFGDEGDRLVPMLLLRDGSAVMLAGLTTRSGARLHRMLDVLAA